MRMVCFITRSRDIGRCGASERPATVKFRSKNNPEAARAAPGESYITRPAAAATRQSRYGSRRGFSTSSTATSNPPKPGEAQNSPEP